MATTTSTTSTGPPKAALAREAALREPAAPPRAVALTSSAARAWSGEDRYRMIAEVAYFNAERRGFAPGSELDDWLAAEIEVDELLAATGPR